MAVLDSYRSHSAIAIEVDVIFEQWWISMIWLNAEECSVDFCWDNTIYFEIYNIA
jgi:hypothetical protein